MINDVFHHCIKQNRIYRINRIEYIYYILTITKQNKNLFVELIKQFKNRLISLLTNKNNVLAILHIFYVKKLSDLKKTHVLKSRFLSNFKTS